MSQAMERMRRWAEEARACVANSWRVQLAVSWCGFMSMQIPNVVCVGAGEGEGKGRVRGRVSHPVGDSWAQVSSV